MLEEDEEAELRNPFPSPPSHYQKYTTHNLHLLSLLKSRTPAQNEEGPEPERDQREVLANEKDVPDWPLTQLEKPRVDWILEEGEYTVYGDTWFVSDGHLVTRYCVTEPRTSGQGKDTFVGRARWSATIPGRPNNRLLPFFISYTL